MDPLFEYLFDLVIYHHGSLSGHMMKYIGGDIFELERLDTDKFFFLGHYKYTTRLLRVRIQ
jgi:hypothetical protein